MHLYAICWIMHFKFNVPEVYQLIFMFYSKNPSRLWIELRLHFFTSTQLKCLKLLTNFRLNFIKPKILTHKLYALFPIRIICFTFSNIIKNYNFYCRRFICIKYWVQNHSFNLFLFCRFKLLNKISSNKRQYFTDFLNNIVYYLKLIEFEYRPYI